MEDYKLIIAGVIGSAITLLLTAIIDFCRIRLTSSLEVKKLFFQRKTEAVEKAMSWYQEALDCWRMMQMSFDELETDFNSVTYTKFIISATQADRLYKESNTRLNPIYLYYDFKDIEQKHSTFVSEQCLNRTLVLIGKYKEQVDKLLDAGAKEDTEKIMELKRKAITQFKILSENIDSQINSIVEIQNTLRTAYQKYQS